MFFNFKDEETPAVKEFKQAEANKKERQRIRNIFDIQPGESMPGYIVVSSDRIAPLFTFGCDKEKTFERVIQHLMEEGYVPVGGISIAGGDGLDKFAQAMKLWGLKG